MQNNNLRENKMGVMPVGKLLANMALPMIISMLVQALYNVIDSIYVSQVSESAVTALALAFPIQNLQIGFAVGIGVGVNSLLSKSLGERNQEAANRAAGNGFFLMFVVTVGFVLFGIFGARPYFEMQSTVTETVEGGIVVNTPDRSKLNAVQTPQVFDIDMLKGALLKAYQDGAEVTDDCSAVERLGMKVKIVEGDEKNLKVTTPMDLKIAEMLLEETV